MNSETIKKKAKERGLKTTLFILGILILGLGGGILAVWLKKAEEFPEPDSGPLTEITFPQSMHTEALEKINKEAEEMTTGEAKELYEKTINEASSDKARAEAEVEYGRYLLNIGEAESALRQLEEVDEMVLDAGYKILLYSGFRKYYDSIGDMTLYEEYNNKISEVTRNSDYAAGG